DGGGKKITCGTGMTWNTVTLDGGYLGSGLFGAIWDGSVKNMTLNNMTANVTGSTAYVHVGAVAAHAKGGTFERITVNNVNLTVTNPNAEVYMGGAFGIMDSSTVDNCAVSGSITGNATNTQHASSHIGGFVGGSFNSSNIKNSTAYVNVTDNSVALIFTGGFVGYSDKGNYANNKCGGAVNITQSAAGSITGLLYVGGFTGYSKGDTTMRNNIASSVITFSSASYTAGNAGVGGFVGFNDNTPAANYSNNTYIGTVGANGNFAAQVALRVGSGSNPNITEDAQIRKVAAPQVIEITNLTTEPKIGQWINAKTSVALSAKVTSTLADAKHVFVANTASADVSAAILTLSGTGDAFSGTLTPAMLANLSNDGTLYLCAQNKNGTTETARASVAFKVLRDAYSPRMSNVSAQSMQDGTVNVSLEATDTQSGVKTVFASAASTNPPDTGRTPLTYNQNTKKWSTAFTGGVWYLYAVDNVGNVSAVPEKIETAVSDIIPIYSYADLIKIGVAKGYPLSGKYIQM
ncbi:MAG: hypothetical protein RR632_07690, partial [Christensenella sp.]